MKYYIFDTSTEAVIFCFIFILCAFMVLPGTESNYEWGKMKFSIKTPPKLYNFLGFKGQSLNARNTDDKETQSIIISYNSNARIPTIDFLEGVEYFDKIYESKDGTKVFYSAKIPPGKQISTVSPATVYANPIDIEGIKEFLKFWKKETATEKTKK